MRLQRYLELSEAMTLPDAAHPRSRNVLMLADNRHPANVVRDHIDAFGRHSRHTIRVVDPIHEPISPRIAWNELDAILVHYSIFVLGEYFLPAPYARMLRRFPGPKLQIIQDEYRHINDMKLRQAELGIAAVFSSLAPDALARVYGDDWLRCTQYFSCLPGYIPTYFRGLEAPLIADRPLDLVYRGRELPYWLGRTAQEKQLIGEQMRKAAGQYGLKADIDWTETSRVYGDGWMHFLMAGRATMGVEGGASIFDFDECIKDLVETYIAVNPEADFEEVFNEVLRPFEGNVVHRTITPRILEAIASKTAMVLYPGEYRGLLQAGRHYIRLERDGSNMPQVVEQLRDTAYLQDMVDRAHNELFARVDLSMAYYVQAVDSVIANLCATSSIDYQAMNRWRQDLVRTGGAKSMPWRILPGRRFAALAPGFPSGIQR